MGDFLERHFGPRVLSRIDEARVVVGFAVGGVGAVYTIAEAASHEKPSTFIAIGSVALLGQAAEVIYRKL